MVIALVVVVVIVLYARHAVAPRISKCSTATTTVAFMPITTTLKMVGK